MATITAQPTASLRDRFKVTRVGVFSILFIIAGVWLIVWANGLADRALVTTVGLGENTEAWFGVRETAVPVYGYALFVGVVYLVSGAVGLIPVDAVRNIKGVLLILCGVFIIPTVLIVAAAGDSFNAVVMLQASVRLATPVIMGAMAGIWCERAGVVNIAIEGMMLTGAAFGFVAFTLLITNGVPGGLWIGVIVAVLAGGLMATLHAWLSITFRTDQIVSGTVINILAVGITSFLRREVLLSSDAGRETLQPVVIPFLSEIPVLGEVLFSGKPIFYSMLVLVVVTHVVIYYTQWGLRTRAVGENPHAADTLGINVNRTRWINVMIGGCIAGLAGAWFSLETTGSFDDNMTNGTGFIALAAMIFGKWTPFGAAAGGLLFGFSDALGQRFQILGVNIPAQFVQMTPYLVTIIVLAGLVGRATAPAADGIPFEKE